MLDAMEQDIEWAKVDELQIDDSEDLFADPETMQDQYDKPAANEMEVEFESSAKSKLLLYFFKQIFNCSLFA